MEPRPCVAVIGLGRMGSVIARHLSHNFDVLGWDVRPVELPGVVRAESLGQLASHAQIILSSLPTADQTRDVLSEGTFRRAFEASDGVFADLSTSAPSEIRALAETLGPGGSRIIDAPILGRPESCGSWTIPVGGEAAAVDVVRPVLEKIASRVIHVGSLGSGHTIKLLNNMMFAAINVITAEAVGACDWLGVDPSKFVDIVGGSAAATVSPLFRALAPRMLGEDLEPVFTVALLDKDLRLAVEMCQASGVPLVSAPALQAVTRKALEHGLGQRDSSALVQLYRQGSGHG